MKKLEKLTPEQEAQIPVFLKTYEDMFYQNQGIDKPACEKGIEKLYDRYLKKPKPMVMYMDSPFGVQVLISILKSGGFDKANLRANLGDNLGDNLTANLGANLRANLGDNLGDNLTDNLGANLRANLGANLGANLWDNLTDNLGANLTDNLGDNLRANLWDNLGANLRDNLGDNLGANLWDNLTDNLWANLGANLRDNLRANLTDNLRANLWDNLWANLGANLRDNYERSAYWTNIGDYGWVAFYDFIQHTGYFINYDFKPLNNFRNLLVSGLYEIHVFDGLCIVSSMPKVKQDDQKRLHCENDPAAIWPDGFSMWYYHGMAIPGHWVENKESITAEEIKKESNAERRRALRDILKADQYYELLGGVNELDHDTDNQGHEMILYESKEIDSVVDKKIQYLEVICPSTMRKYVLYPTKPCKNVWEAKESTFQNQKIQYRHGDVGLLNLAKAFNQPIYES